jgi:hypothetical protein
MYMDAVMFEGGFSIENTAAISKIFNTTLLNNNFAERHAGEQENIEALMRQFAYGAAFGDKGYTLVEINGALHDAWDARMGTGQVGLSSFLPALTEFSRASALTTSVPLVSEKGALTILPSSQIIGTMWADADYLLLAVFNSTVISLY